MLASPFFFSTSPSINKVWITTDDVDNIMRLGPR
jgi:hypothetical protein